MLYKRHNRLKEVLKKRQPHLTVLMEDIHKPHNLSAIIRTCDAVGILDIHVVNKNGNYPTFSKISQGSDKWVFITSYNNINDAINTLKHRQFKIYAAHFSNIAIDYRNVNYTEPIAILLGAEKWGVSKEASQLVDGHITIPMLGMVQSLNVSVAAAVILFEAQRQRLEAKMYTKIQLSPKTYSKILFEWSYPNISELYKKNGRQYPALEENGQILEGNVSI
ncbi:MAG: rRNA methylase [Candidatus Atelocyanobacterium thalassa isolate SIO64986]|uniref:tRNA (guanosine(18)-2'-O)-methyltransferase n=1 Tax=Candidatus Atelocyanobacterium thalassa isolate SIO64986 TaxID=1527444 RepID=A0A086CGQ0_9CHRO|nr:MAG: rRNA methylase [Candidatus Atelocyanobacterium thalassa isolate SIO64986]